MTLETSPTQGYTAIYTQDIIMDMLMEVNYAMPGFLPTGGIGMINGRPKSGKTLFVWSAIAEMLSAGTWLGTPISLYPHVEVWAEESIRATRRKLNLTHFPRTHQVQEGSVRVAFSHERQGEVASSWVKFVEERMDQWDSTSPPSLLVVDTLAHWAFQGRDSNDMGESMSAMYPLQRLVAEYSGLSILALHQNRKGGGKDGEEILGSTAITATVDCFVSLVRHRDPQLKDERRIIGNSRDDGDINLNVIWESGIGRYMLAGSKINVQDHVLDVLKYAHKPLTYAEIIRAYQDYTSEEVSESVLRRTLQDGPFKQGEKEGRRTTWTVLNQGD